MKGLKKLFKFLIFLLILVVVAGGVAYFYVDSIAEKAIERGGEMALGVPTELDKVHVSLWGGEATLTGLQVANPSGFQERTFLRLGQGDAAVSIGSLLSDTVRMPRIRLSDISINLEQKGKKNNVQPLLARAKSMAGGAEQPAEKNLSKDGKTFIVEYFSLDNVEVNAALELLGQTSDVTMKLPKIELRNLGDKENGLTMPELVQKVVQAVLSAAQNSSAQFSPALAQLLQGELGDLDAIQADLVGKARGQVEGTIKKLKEKLPAELPEGVNEEVEKMLDEKTGELLKKGMGDLLGN